MLSRSELKSLQAHRAYPSVSVLAPTHRTAPANRQDPIRVKNLVRKAIQRLHKEFRKRDVAAIVKNLQKLVENVDWQHTLDGLALFASAENLVALSLPFRVKPRAMIDATFATRDLVYALNRSAPYRVLALGHTSRLFDAWTNVLEERLAGPFPLVHKGRGGALKPASRFGVNPSALRDEAHRQYFRTVAEAVAAVQKDNRLPLVVAGVERNLAFYREVTRQPDDIACLLSGNHAETSPSHLGKLAWSMYDGRATERRTAALVHLDDAVSANRYASGIAQVWREAAAGKCRVLLVEKDFKYPADVAADGLRLSKYTGEGAQALDDAVDEVIERVLAGSGEVEFYSAGDLAVHQGIAAILRS